MRPSASRRDGEIGPSSPTKGRSLVFVVLGVVVLVAAITIPWQRRQWAELARARSHAAAQEQRLRDVRGRRTELQRIEAALEQSPQNLETRLEAARSFLSSGDSARAAEILQKIEREAAADPALAKDAALAGALSSLYERIGWQDKALEQAEKAYRLEPDSVDSLIRVAFLEALLGWQKQCQAHVREAVRRAPESAEPHLAQALVFDQIGGLPAAEKELREADRLRPGDWRIQLLLARNRMAQQRYDEALASLETALAAAPAEAALVAAQADALLQKVEALPKRPADLLARAEAAARRYLEMAPESPEATFLMGRALYLKGDLPGAKRYWEQVYARQPDFGRLRIGLGTLLARTGDRARGAKLLEEARRDQEIGNEYHRLVTAAGQQRDDADAHRQLARHCRAHGRIPRAIVEWQQVLRIVPGDKEALAGIADAKKVRGDLP